MRILIYGTGAIGAWLTAGLIGAGHEVTCIARHAFIDAVSHDGLLVEQANGTSRRVTGIQAHPSFAALRQQIISRPSRFDAILLCVKAYSMQSAINELQEWDQYSEAAQVSKPLLICFQNGVGSDDIAVNAFGRDRVIAATTTTPVSVSAPGMLKIERSGGAVCLAPLGNVDTASLISLFGTVAPTVRVYSDYRSLRWSKLLLNIMGNASSAILDMPVGSIYADQKMYRMELAMLHECIEVVRRLDVRFTNLPRYPAASLAWAMKTVPARLLQPVLRYRIANARGAKRPSLNNDVINKTGCSEVEWLNGAVVKYGQEIGIPTPMNDRLTSVLRSMITGHATQQEWRNNITRLVDWL